MNTKSISTLNFRIYFNVHTELHAISLDMLLAATPFNKLFDGNFGIDHRCCCTETIVRVPAATRHFALRQEREMALPLSLDSP